MLKNKDWQIKTIESINVENDFIHSSINDSFIGENAFRIYLKQITKGKKISYRVNYEKAFKGEFTNYSKNFDSKASALLCYRTIVIENKNYIKNLAGI